MCIVILTVLLPEKQAGEAWERSKQYPFEHRGKMQRKVQSDLTASVCVGSFLTACSKKALKIIARADVGGIYSMPAAQSSLSRRKWVVFLSENVIFISLCTFGHALPYTVLYFASVISDNSMVSYLTQCPIKVRAGP